VRSSSGDNLPVMPAIDLWIDEVVVDSQQIGCQR
jgi:hypothetical protein